MNIAKVKRLIFYMLLAIMFIALKYNILDTASDISTAVIFIYNSFDYRYLIDVYSISIYAIPIALWTLIITISCNSFYENYIFLVTRLGGQKVFKSKLCIKAIFETFCLILSTYIFTMLFLYLLGKYSIGNIGVILFSFTINYSTVLFLVLITLIFRIHHSFSISIAFTYLIEISLLVIGVFFEYFQLNNFLITNPLMSSILFFHNKPSKNHMLISSKSIVINIALIVIVYILYNILLRKKEES
ncbi:hypothetical protein [Clostridium sp. FP1]|uniref:hypothetical protein n=1 Tax=Clostridium sp. FP1 TaxID=2724076 RepID=UPI0013E92C95|nr:hypothetical protein [Clostridium sp. FP1]MBZ9637564.1 hypothetical protein [Clostridium sp. FP1]